MVKHYKTMTLEKYNFKITTIKARANKNNGATKRLHRDELDLAEHENNKIFDTSSKNIHSSKDITKNACDSNSILNQRKDNKIEDFSSVKCKEKNVSYNPKVLIERLPEHVVKKALQNKENVNVKSTDGNSVAKLCARFCENCKKTFNNYDLKTTTCCPKCKNVLIYECKKCKKHAKSYTGMLYHIRTSCQSQGNYYQCPGCPYKSTLKNRIKEHMQKLHKNLSVSDMKIIATGDLQKDVKNSEIHVHKCSKCGQQFRHLHFLNRHLIACGSLKYRVGFTGENAVGNEKEDSSSSDRLIQPVPIPDTLNVIKMAVLYCKKCDEKTSINDIVYGPQKCNNCKSDLLFECTKCENQYKSAKGIIYHLKSKCAAQEIMYYCTKCDYKNPVKTLITDHYNRIHESDTVECPKCMNVLKNKSSLMKHLEYCGKKAYLQCDLCSFKTNHRNFLIKHIQRHNFNDNKIEATCPKCNKRLKNAFSLRCHLHYCGQEPRYRCTICAYKSHYKTHVREHTIRIHFKDENKYPACPKCGAKFGYKHCANAHMRYCGSTKRHFQCHDCPFRCVKKCELRSHIIRVHLRNLDNSDDSDVDIVN